MPTLRRTRALIFLAMRASLLAFVGAPHTRHPRGLNSDEVLVSQYVSAYY